MIPDSYLERYNRLIDAFSDIERKGKTTPYTSMNGHMFSFLTKEGVLGLRLSKEDRERFMEDYDSELMEQHGRIMKEYVEVPEEVWEKEAEIRDYFALSIRYVSGLKPKKTTR